MHMSPLDAEPFAPTTKQAGDLVFADKVYRVGGDGGWTVLHPQRVIDNALAPRPTIRSTLRGQGWRALGTASVVATIIAALTLLVVAVGGGF